MNKAFVKEPDSDNLVLCPHCGATGLAVGKGPLDTYAGPEARKRLEDDAWFCGYIACDVAYFDLLERIILISELKSGIYPFDPDAPICACFGFTCEDIEADIRDRQPIRIRELLRQSQSGLVMCQARSPDGQCCAREVQRLYLKLCESDR